MMMSKTLFITALKGAVIGNATLKEFAEQMRIYGFEKERFTKKEKWIEPTIEDRMAEMKEQDELDGKELASPNQYRKWATEEWNENHEDYLKQNGDDDYPVGGMVERYDIERDEREDEESEAEKMTCR